LRNTSFLYTPRAASCSNNFFVVGPALKSPAENRSMPVTLSLVETTSLHSASGHIQPDDWRDFGLLEQWRNQAVSLSTMLHTIRRTGVDFWDRKFACVSFTTMPRSQ